MDFNAIASQVVSSAVVGLITWSGGVLIQQLRSKNAPASPTAAAPAPVSAPVWGAQPPVPVALGPAAPLAMQQPWPVRPPVHAGLVAMHAGALQFGANVIGLFVGLFTLALAGGRSDALAIFIAIQLVLGTIFLAAGFFVIALLVEHAVRWLHLTYVALGTAAMTLLVNALFGAGPTSVGAFILDVIVALCQTFLAMGIGGGLAMLLSPRRAASGASYPVPVAAQPSQPYAWGPAPYGNAPYPPYGPGNGPAYSPAAPSVPFRQPAMPSAPLYQQGIQPGMPQYPPGAVPGTQPSVPLYPQQPVTPAGAPLSQPVYQPGAPQYFAPPPGPASSPVPQYSPIPYGPSQPLAGTPAAWGPWAPGAPPNAAYGDAQGAAVPPSRPGQPPAYPPAGEQAPQAGGQRGIDHPHFQPW